jgi:hypothetical protein
MKIKNLPVFLLLAILPALAGCLAVVAAGGAAGGMAYIKGELLVELEKEVTAVNNAIEKAGQRLELHPISAERDLMGGKFVFRNAQDEKITVTSTARTSKGTELSIRVGMFGDQQRSQMILDRIRKEL